MNNTTLIRMVISTLNDVEVKGKDNLDRLLGCINALESVVQIMEAPAAPEQNCTEPANPDQEVANGR